MDFTVVIIILVIVGVICYIAWSYGKISSDVDSTKKDESGSIFFCVKCHYAFKNENKVTTDVCPDCGGDIVFSGLSTVEWRGMSAEEREAYKVTFFENYLKENHATAPEREIIRSIKQIERDVHFIKSVVLVYVVCVLILLFIVIMLFVSFKQGISRLF